MRNTSPQVLASGRLRVALYSHDTMGLGHIRRNLLIAQALAGSPLQPAILLIAGTREAAAFSLPPGADCVTLPALHKGTDGGYQPRCLDVTLEALVALRARTIAAALQAFVPDVLVVDKVPRGALRELEPALRSLRDGGKTCCILGLRDVLDDAANVRLEWREGATGEVVRDYYDAIWIYGDATVYDQVREYAYPADLAAKVRYTGYITRPIRTRFSEIEGAELLPLLGSPERLFLCMVGGGQDGPPLAETFAQVDFPAGTKGVILTGPFMPPEALRRLYRQAAGKPRLRVLRFVTDPDLLLSLAERVVAMGGYNTVCEVLAFKKPALIVPRVHPRQEQQIRAQRLEQMGLVHMLRPEALHPKVLSRWLFGKEQPTAPKPAPIDLDGAANVPRLLMEMLTVPARTCQERKAEYARP
jgi:predicted glycosyltransferase